MTAIYAHRGNIAFPASQLPPNGAALRTDASTAGDGQRGDRGSDVLGDPASRENTLEAFGAARRAGADGVELDARLTADEMPVIHHDRRVPDGRELANITGDSLPHSVPTLEQALLACTGLSVNIEVKQDEGDSRRRTAPAVAELLAQLALPTADRRPRGGLAAGVRSAPGGLPPVLVSSFDEDSLAIVRAAQPAVPLGLLIDWRTPPAAGLARAVALGCATLHPFVTQVSTGLVADAADAGIGLHVWTVNADADLTAMAELRVAAVITDRVTAAVRLLRPVRPPNGGLRPVRPPNGGGVTG